MERRQRRNTDWKKRTEIEAVCSLTFLDVAAAVAVIFPSGGNKVTLACVRTVTGGVGGCGAGASPCWRGPVLVEVTGARSCSPGAPDTMQHLPREMQRQHIFLQEVGMENMEGKKLSASFLSHCSVTLFCYSINPHVKGRQCIKYWYNLVCIILHFAVRV